MDFLERMNSVLDYIEDNLDGEINDNKIAMLSASSKGMFQRLFAMISDMTLAEYIRKRKLTEAVFDIRNTDEKIIDIAAKYGYNSIAFCAAFKNFHKITPSEARKSVVELNSFQRFNFILSIIENKKGENSMENNIIKNAKILIRQYKKEDESVLKSAIKNDDIRYMEDLSAEHSKLTVAEYDKIVAGYLWTTIYMGHCQAFIYVSPEYRRLGIGAALCCEAEKIFSAQKEIKEMWGYYYDFETIKFIDKLGFYLTLASLEMEYKGKMLPYEKKEMIRKCKAEDFEKYCYIWDKAYHEMRIYIGYADSKQEEANEEKRQQFINNLNNSYILEEDGEIVGIGCTDGVNAITALAVDKKAHNKGYGTALAIFITNEILKNGNKNVVLTCDAKNLIVRNLYEKIGYRIKETVYSSFKKINL